MEKGFYNEKYVLSCKEVSIGGRQFNYGKCLGKKFFL